MKKTNTEYAKYYNKTQNRVGFVFRNRFDSKTIYIGSFDTAIDGAVAYDKYIIDNNLEHTKNF